MQIINSNLVTQSLQTRSNTKHAHGSMSKGRLGHDMDKMDSINNKEQMQTDCNMKGMHENITASSTVKTELSNKILDSNLGVKLDIQA